MNFLLKRRSLSTPFWVALLVLLILLTVLVLWYLLYYSPTFTRLLELTGLSGEKSSYSVRYTGEAYAGAGDQLAVASSVGAQLFARDGTLLAQESFTMDAPAVAVSEKLSVFYDIGGTALCIITADGESILFTQSYPILSANVSRGGYITIVTEFPDEKGKVYVYSPELVLLCSVDCGAAGYPLCARVSPRKTLEVCCLSSVGSSLRSFDIDSNRELGSFTLENGLILDFNYLENGTAVAVTEKGLLFFNEKGGLRQQMDFSKGYPVEYCLSGDCAAVLLRSRYSGSEGTLVTFSSDGRGVGALEVDRRVSSLDCRDGQLLVLYEDELTLYPTDFSDSISYQHISNGKRALLCGENRAMLLGSYGAEIIRFPR